MKIHEYQAKEIFREYNVRVPAGKPAFTVAEALSAYDMLDSETVVVKAQIHACLLYTSPSPRDLSTSRMPSSA